MTEKEEVTDKLQELREAYFKERSEMLDALIAQFGPDVKDVVRKFVIEDSKKTWSAIAKKEGRNDISTLIRTLWEPMKGWFEYTYEEKDGGIQMKVTRCPFADMAIGLGKEDWGFEFYCMSDYGIMEGFNPEIEFKRSKTLMEKHDCCDHFYCMKK